MVGQLLPKIPRTKEETMESKHPTLLDVLREDPQASTQVNNQNNQIDEHIDDLVGVFTDPIIVWPSPWQDTMRCFRPMPGSKETPSSPGQISTRQSRQGHSGSTSACTPGRKSSAARCWIERATRWRPYAWGRSNTPKIDSQNFQKVKERWTN